MDAREPSGKISISRNVLIAVLLLAFAGGIFLGGGFMSISASRVISTKGSFVRSENFQYIRTAVTVRDSDEQAPNKELSPFRYKIKSLIDDKIRKKEIRSASVYFRDLNNGNWFGIGEKEMFSPKNLLKLPLMMAYFKWAEFSPSVLRKRLHYTHLVSSGNRPVPSGLEPGEIYTVRDLIYRMIADDDDGAYELLSSNMPAERLDKVFKDLNVEYDPHKADDRISLRSVASFYRVLFNASYLNEEFSEKALRFLTKASLRQSMASAIPLSVDIAGKHGELTAKIADNGTEIQVGQVHEFGIIYHPHRPFLIGIMVRGDDAGILNRTIRDVTKAVYEEIDSQS